MIIGLPIFINYMLNRFREGEIGPNTTLGSKPDRDIILIGKI